MSKVLILNESLKSDVAEQPNPRKFSLVIDEYRALDSEENVQIESRDNPRSKQYSVMESSNRRFSFFAIAFTLLSVKVKSINGYIAMWFAPVDNAVSMSDFRSSKVWVGRAKSCPLILSQRVRRKAPRRQNRYLYCSCRECRETYPKRIEFLCLFWLCRHP